MSKITIFRGRTYPVIYEHTDSTGAAQSLVGKALYFTVKTDVYDDNASDTDALIKKTITSHTGVIDGTTLNAAGGITGFIMNDADTYVEPGKYHYDFIVEDIATGRADPPSLFGDFVVKGSPTNRNVGNES